MRSSMTGASGFLVGSCEAKSAGETKAPGPAFAMTSRRSSSMAALSTMGRMEPLASCMAKRLASSSETLYTKTGKPDKIPAIVQEMKACNVMLDSYSYNVWMRALAAVNDISGAERVIDEMKRDGRVASDWTTYSNLASIFGFGVGVDGERERERELMGVGIWVSVDSRWTS